MRCYTIYKNKGGYSYEKNEAFGSSFSSSPHSVYAGVRSVVGAAGGGEYYLDDSGNRLRNTVSEDGYWVNYKGERTSFISAEPEGDRAKILWRDYERGSNFFLKYLETGDTKYLTGSEYITLVAREPVMDMQGQVKNYMHYIDYQSAAKQQVWIRPTSLAFLYFRANEVYPQEKLEFNQKYVFNKDAYSRTDANNHPLYYKPNELKLVDDGDYQVLSGARKKGLTIYEEKDKTGETVYLLSQRDVYKVYKNFLDWATAGTENMGERELALHLEKKVEEYLEYSHTKQAHVVAKDNSRLHIKYITALLADTGVC